MVIQEVFGVSDWDLADDTVLQLLTVNIPLRHLVDSQVEEHVGHVVEGFIAPAALRRVLDELSDIRKVTKLILSEQLTIVDPVLV